MISDEIVTGLFATVCERPSDALAKLVLADRLAEMGLDRLEYAFRWCAKWNKHPSRMVSVQTLEVVQAWCWMSMESFQEFRPGSLLCVLRIAILDEMTDFHNRTGYRVYGTEWDAFVAISSALESIRDMVAIHDEVAA
jgi:hypothetical protein